ncbi:hypothetical protein L914_03277 [Phytophthora nicotianae]|uniref:Uncharacterized protein n=2 Tax=Phytophthora nicotianae TaxID=4792 RepID=V9FSB4_PHYNI|nr:hypothetical protein F443_03422 [Phytophthora nicotianae P1569]ETM53234.1 hypothetical protein L914_03277 [Phytophthora nicotianae]
MRELAARSHFAGNSKPVNSSSADVLYVATRPVHVSSVLRRSAKALKPPRCRGFSNPLSTPRAAVLDELQESEGVLLRIRLVTGLATVCRAGHHRVPS